MLSHERVYSRHEFTQVEMRLQLLVCSRSASGKKCDFTLQFHDVSIGWNLLIDSVKRQLIQILHLHREDNFAFYYIDDEGDAVTVRDSRYLFDRS